MAVVKVFSFSLSAVAGATVLQVSRDIGFPFQISSIFFISSLVVDPDRRLRIFVSIDDDTVLVDTPSGWNILSFGGGDDFFLPGDGSLSLGIFFEEPNYGRRLKAQFENASGSDAEVSGGIIVRSIKERRTGGLF